ncbi:MAG: leucyl/phenylalanyl-tRNA--protein transferase [Bacteroidales bacterium]|nr:leucyl/phenylalanyl-tRNA--protein transferase [Bacteroidales bacterium]
MSPKEIIEFPDPEFSDNDGLLCWGGNLKIETLIAAYSKGIFPWYSKGDPILWWSPPQRMILIPNEFKISKSLRAAIRKNNNVKFDTDFKSVIGYCAEVQREGQAGTWITDTMRHAYIKLHEAGFAHSVEVYENNTLIGGLYGVSLGKAFFGESMFHLKSDASKIALYHLVQKLLKWNFHFIDCQQNTNHLKSLGANEVERDYFLNLLKNALKTDSLVGNWNNL